MIIAESDIFGKEKKKRKKQRRYEGTRINSFNDLSVGDYVVHENHGPGVCTGGIEKVEVDRVTKDYMKIEYAGGSNLYVPATQLDVIQKYADGDAKAPKLNKLGTQEWEQDKDQGSQRGADHCPGTGGSLCDPSENRGLCIQSGYRVAERIRGNVSF